MNPCRDARVDILVKCEASNQEPHFYPRDELESVLTKEVITKLLECSCDACVSQRQDLDLVSAPSDHVDTILQAAISLFALLIVAEATPFIMAFMERQIRDQTICDLQGSFLEADIEREYWAKFQDKNRKKSKAIAKQFRGYFYRFAVPLLTSSAFHIFTKQTILPFTEQRYLGRGSYGAVYACKIWPSYNELPGFENTKWFARKELDEETRLFKMERETLSKVTRLEEPHIVKIIKTYKHGDKYNIIFPLAKANLHEYLRDDMFANPNYPIELNPLWQQLLGVANALHRFHNYDVQSPPAGDVGYYGFHFDLKPENILVEEDGKLLISDFGQATFRERGGSSGTHGHGGTEAYAPPEIDDLNRSQTRKYDIWSLGCIFVEVATVVVRGSAYRDRLNKARRTTEGNITDSRFFMNDATFSGPGRRYKLKSVISEWIKELPEHTRSHKSKIFMDEIVSLINGMLAVDVEARISSDEVVRTFEAILQRYKSDDIVYETELPRRGELPVGARELDSLRLWYKRVGDPDWEPARIRIFQKISDPEELRVVIHGHRRDYEKPALRKELMLVPRYVFGMRDQTEGSLSFQRISSRSVHYLHHDMFSFSRQEDAYVLQSVLTGQCVKLSLKVKKVVYKLRPNLFGSLRSFSGGGSHRIGVGNEDACMVQLWIEKDYVEPPMEQSNRPKTHNLRSRRLVIFHKDRIVVVAFSSNWTVNIDGNETDAGMLHVQPRDAGTEPKFNIATLKPSPDKDTKDYCYPGIPLDDAELREQEDDCQFNCSRISIEFKDSQDRDTFEKKFSEMRREFKRDINKMTPYSFVNG